MQTDQSLLPLIEPMDTDVYLKEQYMSPALNYPVCVNPLRSNWLITKTHLFKYTENFTTNNENFQIKNSNISHISAQNIGCGYSLALPCPDSFNEYPQYMFLSRNKKNNVYHVNPSFTI